MMLKAHVEEILVENDRAVGVRLSDNSVVRANCVVSNASSWDTLKLLPASAVPDEYRKSTAEMPINRSFMHLHLGFDAAGLPPLVFQSVTKSGNGVGHSRFSRGWMKLSCQMFHRAIAQTVHEAL